MSTGHACLLTLPVRASDVSYALLVLDALLLALQVHILHLRVSKRLEVSGPHVWEQPQYCCAVQN